MFHLCIPGVLRWVRRARWGTSWRPDSSSFSLDWLPLPWKQRRSAHYYHQKKKNLLWENIWINWLNNNLFPLLRSVKHSKPRSQPCWTLCVTATVTPPPDVPSSLSKRAARGKHSPKAYPCQASSQSAGDRDLLFYSELMLGAGQCFSKLLSVVLSKQLFAKYRLDSVISIHPERSSLKWSAHSTGLNTSWDLITWTTSRGGLGRMWTHSPRVITNEGSPTQLTCLTRYHFTRNWTYFYSS